MRTIPEIVAQMKELIAELEQHTGLPPKKEIAHSSEDTILFSFDNMNAGQPAFSYYENSGETITISAVGEDIITLGPTKN